MELPPEDEPLMKKQKTEESLEPELQFMMKFNVYKPILFFLFIISSSLLLNFRVQFCLMWQHRFLLINQSGL